VPEDRSLTAPPRASILPRDAGEAVAIAHPLKQEVALDDLILSVLKRAVEELDAEIQLLTTGRRAISDIKDGRIVDASRETLSLKRVFRDRLSDLISKLEAARADRA
jgi:hypothetical protein